ncbi:helix-turn-helix protein [compost metagenome]
MKAETLGEFVGRIRHENGWSRDAVAERAKKAGFRLSGSNIRKIENGESSPTLETVKALAVGLQRDPAELNRVAFGERPKPTSPELLSATSIPTDVDYPPTPEEESLLAKGASLGIAVSFTSRPRFWSKPPEERRRFFRDMEDLIEDLQQLMDEGMA